MGGVAAGKSTVANLFAAHGLVHVDADAIARDVLCEAPVRAELAAAFGGDVVTGQGEVDRARLAALAFGDPGARRRLEAITHPRIRARILAAKDAARQRGRSVLLDAPLLLEGGLVDACDCSVFVSASPATRAARAAARGWAPDELARREAAQAPLDLKKQRATYTIDNDGSLADTARQVHAILQRIGSMT
jgi:dephospho-CoA kinase